MADERPTQPVARRLLVVEDETITAMTLVDALEDFGFRVAAVVGTVPRALEAVERLAGEIDGAVVDANLGGDPADPVARALRAAGVPFVVASGYDRADLRRRGYLEVIVPKPYLRSELRHAVESLFAGGAVA